MEKERAENKVGHLGFMVYEYSTTTKMKIKSN